MRQRAAVTVILAALAAVGNAGCSGPGGGATPSGPQQTSSLAAPNHRVKIKEFSDLPNYYDYYGPSAITAGDGALWVTDTIDQDFGENVVVRIATNGKATNDYYYGGYSTQGASFGDITLGPDGAFWITDGYNVQILRMTTDGNYTSYRLQGYDAPNSITNGPDHALWFTEYGAVGRITTKGKITTYAASGALQDIVTGPDGALWYTEATGNKIGRITTRGKITEYSNGITPSAFLWSIAAGPDGALWFTEYNGGRIGRITTKGQVTEYSNGITPGEHPVGIAAGPDGAMWFTEYETIASYRITDSRVGRITMDGKIKEYSRGIDPGSAPGDITLGPDGNLWFVEGLANRVGRVKL
jgi:streptogramin lyase